LSKPASRHHFRPVLHLRHFADRDGLYAYDKQGILRTSKYMPKAVGAEKYLYSPEDGPEPHDDYVETWLARTVDGPAARALEAARRGLRLHNLQRSRLALYVAAQDMRTPLARDHVVGAFQRGLDAEYANLTEDLPSLRQSIRRATGTRYTLARLRELADDHSLECNKGVWLEFILRNVTRVGEILRGKNWYLVRAPSPYEFLTSDLGIVKFAKSFRRPVGYSFGFSAGRQRWLMPLDPKTSLAIGPTSDSVAVTPAWLQAVNDQIVADAARFVYSRTLDLRVIQQFTAVVRPGRRLAG